MNYFEIFEIPVQLKIKKTDLPKKFFELSRKYHPDYFVNEPEEVKRDTLEKASHLNKAFRVFQNEDETIKYVLQLKGLLDEEEKYQLPNDFLMEVLEINEQVMDAEEDDVLRSQLETKIENLQIEIYEPVQKIIENYKDGITPEKELLEVKEYYYKKKYLDRIKKQLGQNM